MERDLRFLRDCGKDGREDIGAGQSGRFLVVHMRSVSIVRFEIAALCLQ